MNRDSPGIDEQLSAAVQNPVLLQAAKALNDGRVAVAENLLKNHLTQSPFDVAAIRLLAELAARIGRYTDSERLLRRALEISPNFTVARLNYAAVLQRLGKFVEARTEAARVLSSDPDHGGALAILAAVNARTGRFEEAIAAYQNILNRYPRQAQLWVSLGHVLKTVGRQAESVSAYRQAIALTRTLGDAWWSLANLKTVQLSANDVAKMQDALTLAMSNIDRYHLHFALGKAFEDLHEFEQSFRHYAEGNRMRCVDLPYDRSQMTRHVASSKSKLSRAVFEDRRGQGCEASDPIFIVGLPRSGSTLIEQILASHSQVEGTMELPDVIALSEELGERMSPVPPDGGATPDYLEQLLALGAAELQALGRSYLERTRLQRSTNRPFFIDKMPNNFAHIGMIALMLPNAKIIDARRHPMATCLSCFKQHFSRGQRFTYDLQDLGHYYRDYLALMVHFDAVLPDRIHRIHYENMVADPETEIRALLAHCGLEFEASCLEFHRNSRAVRTASSEQVRRPIDHEALDRWRRFEPWLEPLKRSLGDVLEHGMPTVPAT